MSATAMATTWLGRTGTSARRRVTGLHTRLRRRERPSLWPLALAAALLLLVCLGLVWVRLQSVRSGYQLSTAQQVEERLIQEERELAIELATLTSPRRLERLARTRLGMQSPEPGQIVNVR
jgi:cell division protein FtsL